nr:hypothetical protein [Tanacetum cinerariifolium]
MMLIEMKALLLDQPKAKSTGKFAQAVETLFDAGNTQVPQDLGKDIGNTDEPPVVKAGLKDWFKKPKRPLILDPEWNECKTVNSTSHWISKRQIFCGYASNRVSKHDVYSTKRILAVTMTKSTYAMVMVILRRLKFEDLNRLFNLKGEDIVPLAAALRMFTRRIVIQKRVEDLQVGVESYQKKLDILRPLTHKAGITDLEPYTTYSNPQGVIYLEKLVRNRLMCSHELYKFSDGTLISVRDKLKYMLNNLEIGYKSVMPKRRLSNLDKKRSRIMVKDIDRQLMERRLMRSLEKFVGGREYGEDLRLLQRTI